MRTSKFSESQIVTILKQQEGGLKVADICREHGISAATFYKWRSKYGGRVTSTRSPFTRAPMAALARPSPMAAATVYAVAPGS